MINLDRRPDRWDRVARRLSNSGFDLHRVQAVDADELRKLSTTCLIPPAQVACAKSHVRAYQELASSRAGWGIVLEDDAVVDSRLNPDLLSSLTASLEDSHIGLLQLGWISPMYGPRSNLKSRIRPLVEPAIRTASMPQGIRVRMICGEFRAGAHAYFVDSAMAEDLATLNDPVWLPQDRFLAEFARTREFYGTKRVARLTKSLAEQESRTGRGTAAVDSDLERLD